MDEEAEYKLIHVVNPTKVKIPIREKFAKLTLSSNKKKEVKLEDDVQVDKRKSASRNLMEQLNDTESKYQRVHINPLLRSSSSSRGSSDNMIDDIKQLDTELLSTTDTMEPLQISEVLTQPEYNAVDILSEQMSEMIVSQTPSNEIKTEDSSLIFPEVVKNIKSDCGVICVSSSSENEDSESVISLSDSSTRDAGNITFDYSLMTSDIPKSGETENFVLPDTLSNENADRIDTFLRDVAKQFKEGSFNSEMDTLTVGLGTSRTDNGDRAKLVAALDTMSMSVGGENLNFSQSDLTTPLSRNHTSIFIDEVVANSNENDSLGFKNNDSKRLASNETEINTQMTSFNFSHNQSSVISDTSSRSSILKSGIESAVEDSIVIPETGSEADTSRNSSYADNDLSVETETPAVASLKPQDSEISQVSISMGKINISARINIKIQVSGVEGSSSEDSSSNNSSKNDSAVSTVSEVEGNPVSRSVTEVSQCVGVCEQRQQLIPSAEVGSDNCNTPKVIVRAQAPEDGDEHFISSAEKLLNELYGKSWQTPDVIQTLKRTSGCRTFRNPTVFKEPMSSRTEREVKKPTWTGEESILDCDFSIFRRNLDTPNLNSTVKVTPKQSKSKEHAETERKQIKKRQDLRDRDNVLKGSQTERKKKPLTTKSGRLVRWRQLISDDSDSDGVNASDDMDADETRDSELERSWSGKELSDEDDSPDELPKSGRGKRLNEKRTKKQKDGLVYLDLSKEEVTIYEGTPASPPANHDETFNSRLKEVLKSCSHNDKPKLPATPQSTVKTKRKLFTANFGLEDEIDELLPVNHTPKDRIGTKCIESDDDIIADAENINILNGMDIVNKKLESVKTGKPIFKLIHPKIASTPTAVGRDKPKNLLEATPKTTKKQNVNKIDYSQPWQQYSFLKSLDEKVSKLFCDPDALYYRENYRQKKEELAKKLFELYNEKLFDNKLDVPLLWNKKLLNTAGRCMNKKTLGVRCSVIELSEKVLTSADRLRCTLIHELCHAATWIFNGEGGHGSTWKSWARRANATFPDIPKIGVCHQYDIEYKYTYKCTLCGAKSHAHSKSRKVENIRCLYCHGAIEIYLNKKDKQGNSIETPVREPTGFAKFVKEKYNHFKRPDLKHADVMKILSNEFNALKLANKK